MPCFEIHIGEVTAISPESSVALEWKFNCTEKGRRSEVQQPFAGCRISVKREGPSAACESFIDGFTSKSCRPLFMRDLGEVGLAMAERPAALRQCWI